MSSFRVNSLKPENYEGLKFLWFKMVGVQKFAAGTLLRGKKNVEPNCFGASEKFRHIHIKSEHEGRQYKYENCSYESKCKNNVYKHTKAMHENVRYQCNICDFSAKGKIYLSKHTLKFHCE